MITTLKQILDPRTSVYQELYPKIQSGYPLLKHDHEEGYQIFQNLAKRTEVECLNTLKRGSRRERESKDLKREIQSLFFGASCHSNS